MTVETFSIYKCDRCGVVTEMPSAWLRLSPVQHPAFATGWKTTEYCPACAKLAYDALKRS